MSPLLRVFRRILTGRLDASDQHDEAVSAAVRSSTASHYDADYATATAGEAEKDFYGIRISNDLSGASTEELLGLLLLLAALSYRPAAGAAAGGKQRPVAFWVAVIAVLYPLRRVALLPLLTTVIYTRTSYPYLVVLPHCIVSAACYRYREESSEKKTTTDGRASDVHYLASFVLGFLCFGFGGSIVSDLFMGLPITALGHARIVPCWVLGWLLVWFSPGDVVYASWRDPSSFWHYLLNVYEAVDAVTTPMGRTSRSARELQNKVTAPIVAGLLAGAGGGAIRYVEWVVLRGQPSKARASLDALELAVWRSIGYSALWWFLVVHRCENGMVDPDEYHCDEYNGSDSLRVVMVVLHVLWALACDVGLGGGHPFFWAFQKVQHEFMMPFVTLLNLGPQPVEESEKRLNISKEHNMCKKTS